MEQHLQQFKQKLQSFAPMHSGIWETLTKHLSVIGCPAERPLTMQPGICYLAEGLMMQCKYHADTEPTILRFIPQGTTIPMSMGDTAQLKAILPCRLLWVGKKELEQLTVSFPDLRRHYDAWMSGWYQLLEDRSELLLLPPKERKQAFISKYPNMIQYIKIKDLAIYLAMQPNYLGVL
ncbi:Crp/Fnr family transcriptional regulator [Parapedobacter sp. ISTM3]|uniref:cAMP-binding domain of CRP or a regulatory subunit of cAMP-dependent protein kinases n=1 Tax=Parapedobacter luteus TaxID=623280 RepID=A0A1T5EK29_9SPHI|nr:MULTISPECIES: Crp/Fnr family transcriptional regulator [Parapedobacter]MBK1441372.1 Crp/Fnr family transcriptional regulator [Parapedobacter sp. ISTM3]SKB84239.1 hypothetical protein SAMN05660226_03355 [Parapedobacter luteus]